MATGWHCEACGTLVVTQDETGAGTQEQLTDDPDVCPVCGGPRRDMSVDNKLLGLMNEKKPKEP